MKCALAFSAAGVHALAASGRFDRVVVRGWPALNAARVLGLVAVSTDDLFDTATAEAVDRESLATARRWRAGALSSDFPEIDVGIVAEYEVIHIVGRILRLAAALMSLDAPAGATLRMAASAASAEAGVARAVAHAKGWGVAFVAPGSERCPPYDIPVRGPQSKPLARRLARYWLARLATRSGGDGYRIAAYVSGEAAPLLGALAETGVARLVLDPSEPPSPLHLARRLRGHALWAGGGLSPSLENRSQFALVSPPLKWQEADLQEPVIASINGSIIPQIPLWRRYARDLLTAWSRARPQAVVLTNDCTASSRVRVLVAERLGIPSIIVQHGVLMWIGDRNHEVGDYSAVWGNLVVEDFSARGIRPERVRVTGWPAARDNLPAIQRRAARDAGSIALILTTNLPLATALVPEDAVERVAQGAARGIRESGWRGPIVAKIHPSQDSEVYRRLFTSAGHPDVTVCGREVDPWSLLARAGPVVTASTSIACGLPHLGCRPVLYDVIRPPFAPYLARFRDFVDAPTPTAVATELVNLRIDTAGPPRDGGERAIDYASDVTDQDARFADLVTRAIRSGPVGQGARHRAIDGARIPTLAFDRLPVRTRVAQSSRGTIPDPLRAP